MQPCLAGGPASTALVRYGSTCASPVSMSALSELQWMGNRDGVYDAGSGMDDAGGMEGAQVLLATAGVLMGATAVRHALAWLRQPAGSAIDPSPRDAGESRRCWRQAWREIAQPVDAVRCRLKQHRVEQVQRLRHGVPPNALDWRAVLAAPQKKDRTPANAALGIAGG